MASRVAVKRQVLGLYAQCLRSARKCPQWEQREMMKAYVKMKFRHDAGVQDPARIQRLLADAREELDQMEYYHSVYEAKQRQKAAAREANTTRTVATPETPSMPPTVCPHCATAYQPATAKFCSNCGEKRML
ncbi:Complex 1 lyr protein, partial [Globisporangium splendens]